MKFSPLRSQLLQLAISGKLTEQLDSEPEVAQLGPAPAPDEVPFAIPPKWKWVQLRTLCDDSFSGGTPSKANSEYWGGDIPWASIKDISPAAEELWATQDHITQMGLDQSSSKLVETGNVIVGMRMGLDRVVINKVPIAINQDLRALYLKRNLMLPEYFVKFYQTLKFEGRGTTVKGIKASQLLATLVPLPPLEEQHRIIAIVDELMSTLDRIEEAYGEFEGPMTEHFRNSALQKAMQGQLVPQLDTEPEVAQLGLAPAPDEVPFAIPPKWKWVQLGMLCDDSFSGGTPSKANSEYWGGDIPWASIKDISPAAEELLATKDHITQSGLDQSSSKLVETGNVIVGMRMGLDRVVINQVPVAINQDLRALYLKRNLILPKYFVKFYQTLKFEGAGTTVKGIKASQLLATLVPLPPLEEQRRIVAKLEELLTGVEQLKSLVGFA